MPDPYDLARQAADRIAELTGRASHDALVVLGSGWGPAAGAFGDPVAAFDMTDVPGFLAPVAEGHAGEIRSYDIAGVATLVYLGRTHLYEGHGLRPVVHGIRAARACGVRLAVLTNANGSLRDDWELGRPVLVSDHLNVTATSPLEGARFVDLTDAWSPRLRAAGPVGRPVARRGRLRLAARPALRDLGGGRVAALASAPTCWACRPSPRRSRPARRTWSWSGSPRSPRSRGHPRASTRRRSSPSRSGRRPGAVPSSPSWSRAAYAAEGDRRSTTGIFGQDGPVTKGAGG